MRLDTILQQASCGVKGRNIVDRKPSDLDLAKQALAMVSGMSLRVAEKRLGVSHQRISDLRKAVKKMESGQVDPFPVMRQDTRDSLLDAVRRGDARNRRPSVPGNGRRSIEREIERLAGLPIPEWQKTLHLDAVASLWWAEAARRAESAQVVRARAMEKAQDGARLRSDRLSQAVDGVAPVSPADADLAHRSTGGSGAADTGG